MLDPRDPVLPRQTRLYLHGAYNTNYPHLVRGNQFSFKVLHYGSSGYYETGDSI